MVPTNGIEPISTRYECVVLPLNYAGQNKQTASDASSKRKTQCINRSRGVAGEFLDCDRTRHSAREVACSRCQIAHMSFLMRQRNAERVATGSHARNDAGERDAVRF